MIQSEGWTGEHDQVSFYAVCAMQKNLLEDGHLVCHPLATYMSAVYITLSARLKFLRV